MTENTKISERNELVFFNVYGIFLRWTKHSSFSYLEAPRPNHGLMQILCDGIRIEYPDGKTEIYTRGNVIYIPEGLRYSVKFFGDSEHLDARLINFSLYGELPHADRIKKLIESANSIYTDCFNTIITLYTQSKNYRYGVMESFYRLLGQINAEMETKVDISPLRKSIFPAISYIESHINSSLRIPHLANLCLLNETAFRKRFKLCTNKKPAEYISDLKLEKAKELLKSRDIPISAIVSELNFYDSAYFHKLFRKKTGISPSEFRRAYAP